MCIKLGITPSQLDNEDTQDIEDLMEVYQVDMQLEMQAMKRKK